MSIDQWTSLIPLWVIGAMGIVAIFLLGYGIRKNKQNCFLYGVALATVAVVYTIDKYPTWGVTLSAFSAIAVAIFAGLTLFENRLLRGENRQLREEERERDFRRRSIDGIIDWALKLTDPRFKIPDVVTTEKPWTTMPELEQMATRNIWVDNVARVFGNDFLSTAQQTTDNLNTYISNLNKWFSGEVKLGKVLEAHGALESSLKELLESAFVIKANERL